MKKAILAIAALSLFAAACQSAATQTANTQNNQARANQNTAGNTNTGAAMNHNGMNHNQMDHGAMNHNGMNHDGMMDHANMQSSPNAASQPYDLQFLDTMIAHHQGAVDMAKPALDKAQHQELKTMAKNIVADQEREIAEMKRYREQWFAGKPQAINMEMTGMRDSMKGMDMKKLNAQTGNDFDVMFLEQMTPHHLGAVVMAKEALQKSEHREIKTLANQIIKSQEAEIKQMNDWRAKWSK